ncbi:MAG TPA: flavin-dependent monooxygenase [Acidimicrobiales bacterium]|nr:flavin-dependent monooxygenase [Acidimicrobiales bacterium]
MSETQVLERVRELTPLIRERAAGAEQERRLPEESVKELKESGLMRLLQPKRYGGYEADPRVFYEALLAIAGACGSTGWVTGVVGVHPWQIALFPDRVQAEVWGDDPDTWVSSSYMPGGRLTPTDGGFTLNGRWSFSSGCDHCRWAILGVILDRGDGGAPSMWNVLIPRTDYRIEDVWHTMGLCGTGSNDIIVEDLFVPEHRTIDLVKMFSWESPGLEVNTSPLYRLPFATMFSNAITGAIIGMAEGILAENLEYTKARVSKSWGKATEDPYTVAALGRAASEVDACRSHLMRNIGDMYETATAGGEVTVEMRSRARRDQVQGTARAIAAIDEIFDRSGAGTIMLANPIQRLWRDAHAGRHHTVNSIDRSLHSYGMTAMGFNPTDVMI